MESEQPRVVAAALRSEASLKNVDCRERNVAQFKGGAKAIGR